MMFEEQDFAKLVPSLGARKKILVKQKSLFEVYS